MKKIEPYKNSKEARLALDNGGRFFNMLTKADDGIISQVELSKVAGLLGDKQKTILFFELSISELDENARSLILLTLDDKLKALYRKYKPQEFTPSEAQEKGTISSNAIITGFPKLVESKSDFNGFIMIPIMVGSITTFTMVPIINQYDVYEIKDTTSAETFLIAHAKSSKKLPEKRIKIAGVIKALKATRTEKEASKKFLDAYYYLDA